MKTAISIPDDLYEEVNAAARRLRLSRSGLFALAVREYLERHLDPTDATDAWNRAIEEAGQPGDDAAAAAARRHSKSVIRAESGGTW